MKVALASATFVSCITLLTGCLMTPSSISDLVNIKPPEPDTKWIPSGFTGWEDNKTAYRTLNANEITCNYSMPCVKYEVVSKDGCDRIYMSIAILDIDGRNIGYSNDLAQGVSAGQKALMTMNITASNASNVLVKELKCY